MHSFLESALVLRRGLPTAVSALFLFNAGCASAPPPSASLRAAQQSIDNAERAEAATYAAAELSEARGKLAAAQSAVNGKEMVAAARLADEARAEADLAVARTSLAKANALNADVERSTAILVEEMQRKAGDSR
jgi:hypothetical protein